MLIDFICVLLLSLWAYLGWRRGLLLSALSLASVLLSYLCAYLLYRPVGDVLARSFSLQPLLAYPLGGMTAFVIAVLLLSVLRAVIRRRRKRSVARGGPLLLAGRIGGAVVSIAYGAAFLLLVLGALLWLRASLPGIPDVRSSVAGRVAAPLMAAFARGLAGGSQGSPTLVGVADRMARDPLRTTQSLGAVLDDRRVRKLASAVRAGRARPEEKALRELAADPQFLRRAEEAGLIQRAEAGPLTPEQAQAQLAARLAPLRRALDAMARDPEVRRMLENPELSDRLRRRDMLALVNDPAFNKLAARVMEHLRGAGVAPTAGPPPTADGASTHPPPASPMAGSGGEGPPRRTQSVYRWKDRSGRLHYSDRPPTDRPYEVVKPGP
jgi:uncharacterized membrane protein required for colicin V production